MDVALHRNHDLGFDELADQRRISRALAMIPFAVGLRQGMNVVRDGIGISDLEYLVGLNAEYPWPEPATVLIDGDRRGGNLKSLSFEALLYIHEHIGEPAVG